MSGRAKPSPKKVMDEETRPMPLHPDSDVIMALKKRAVDRVSLASSIANETIDAWLRQNPRSES
jgi:hypothetical protein